LFAACVPLKFIVSCVSTLNLESEKFENQQKKRELYNSDKEAI
jgi:hypothetical protein